MLGDGWAPVACETTQHGGGALRALRAGDLGVTICSPISAERFRRKGPSKRGSTA